MKKNKRQWVYIDTECEEGIIMEESDDMKNWSKVKLSRRVVRYAKGDEDKWYEKLEQEWSNDKKDKRYNLAGKKSNIP